VSGEGRANPTDAAWLGQTFRFQTLAGPQTITVSAGLQTPHLGYTYDFCPTGNSSYYNIPDPRFLFFVDWRALHYPWPEPPEPWERFVLVSEPIALDGRDAAFVLPRKELKQAKLDPGKRLSVLLQDVIETPLASKGGFFIEAWLAPDAAKLPYVGLKDAARIGSFGAFQLSGHHMHGNGKPQHLPSVALDFTPAALKLLDGEADPAVVFVRRGLVDKDGKPLDYDPKAELYKVGAFALVSGAPRKN
jgi:hypothetical protein